jgi:CRP-like cAMP-binding protein
MPDTPEFEFLRQVLLFDCLTDDEIEVLARVAGSQNFSKNALVILAEDEGDAFFLIKKGRMKVSVTGNDGREIILSQLGPGEYFGELSLLDGKPRSADVTTLDPSELLVLRRQDFLTVIQKHSAIPVHLMITLASRLRKSDRQIVGLALLGISERICSVLLSIAEEEGVETDEGIVIKKRPTHQVIAAMSGTARETITRVMRRLSDEGYIRASGRELLILKQARDVTESF